MSKPTKYATADGKMKLDLRDTPVGAEWRLNGSPIDDSAAELLIANYPCLQPVPEPDWKRDLAEKIVRESSRLIVSQGRFDDFAGILAAAFAHVEQRTLEVERKRVAGRLRGLAADWRNVNVPASQLLYRLADEHEAPVSPPVV